jgi:hypothetical protein
MIENIYRALCKLHEQMPEEGDASAAGVPSATPAQKSQ